MAARRPDPVSPPAEAGRPRPGGWAFPAAGLLVLAVLLGWLGYTDYRNTERELRRLLEDTVATLADPLIQSAQSSLRAYDALRAEMSRHLLASARHLAHLDGERRLTQAGLDATAERFSLQRIHVFDASGRRELSSGGGPAADEPAGERQEVLRPILDGAVPEMVIGFRESRFGSGHRFAAAVARPRGGAIVVSVRADELDRYRQEVGLGPALARLTAGASIAYAIIQDEDGPVSASPGVTGVEAISRVPALREAFGQNRRMFRFTSFGNRDVLEGIVPFELEPGYRALFRIGVDLGFYHSRLRELAWRDAGLSVVFLLVGGAALGLVFLAQRHRFLRSRYLRTLTLSDRITERMEECLLVIDADGGIIRANPRSAELLGLHAGDRAPAALETALPACPPGAAATGARYLPWNGRTFLASCQPFPGEAGRTAGRLLLLRDVTRQRAMEDKLRQEEHLAALGRLVAAVAHEVRNPLNALSMSVQTLRRRLGTGADERWLSPLAVLEEEIDRLNRLVQDLLVYARPAPLLRQPVRLRPLLDRAGAVFAEPLARRGIRMQLDIGDLSPEACLLADEDRVYRVLVNLLANALDSVPDGGNIGLRAAREDDRLRIRITDDGPGFSPEALARALEPFYTTRAQGTGLGLSLSAEIARAHGWELGLANRPDGGAEVTLDAPASDLLEDVAAAATPDTGPGR